MNEKNTWRILSPGWRALQAGPSGWTLVTNIPWNHMVKVIKLHRTFRYIRTSEYSTLINLHCRLDERGSPGLPLLLIYWSQARGSSPLSRGSENTPGYLSWVHSVMCHWIYHTNCSREASLLSPFLANAKLHKWAALNGHHLLKQGVVWGARGPLGLLGDFQHQVVNELLSWRVAGHRRLAHRRTNRRAHLSVHRGHLGNRWTIRSSLLLCLIYLFVVLTIVTAVVTVTTTVNLRTFLCGSMVKLCWPWGPNTSSWRRKDIQIIISVHKTREHQERKTTRDGHVSGLDRRRGDDSDTKHHRMVSRGGVTRHPGTSSTAH